MPRKEKEYKYHFIYKTTNIKNGKFYIGMHSTDNLDDGYLGSGKRLRNSIRRHGKDAHVRMILEFLSDRSSLKKREEKIINEDFLKDPMCMNLATGGTGGLINDEHRKKLMKSSSTGGKKGANIFLKNLQDPLNYESFSKKMFDLQIKRIEKYGVPKYLNFSGKKHTNESKDKMSKKAKERIGESNSQFGTRWINKEGIVKKIKNEELEHYINNKWKLGRKG